MMISESGSVEAMLRGASVFPPFGAPSGLEHHQRMDRVDPMQNQLCRVCEEPAAGFHFGAFTCEGCKSFFGRTCNNQSVIQECKNNYRCVVDKKNRTACKACRLRKCLMVGMSKSGSRYGRRSNWFKIHCLMQQSMKGGSNPQPASSPSPQAGLHTPPPSQAMPHQGLVIPSPKSSSLSPSSPPRSSIWSKVPSKDPYEERHKDVRPRSSSPPTMVPTKSSLSNSLLPPPSPPRTSPFHSLFQASTSSLSPSSSSPMSPPISNSKPGSPVTSSSPTSTTAAASAAAAAAMFQQQFSPLYTSAFPQLGLLSTPGFPTLPLHKQMLLSPLLAQSHLWQQMAAQSRQYPHLNPLFPGLTAGAISPPVQPKPKPEVDLMAEHKALMERFASSVNAAAIAAAAAQQAAAAQAATSSDEERKEEKPKENNQSIPMDLSKREDEEEDLDVVEESKEIEDDLTFKKIVIKSDLNRNNVVQDKPTKNESNNEMDEEQ